MFKPQVLEPQCLLLRHEQTLWCCGTSTAVSREKVLVEGWQQAHLQAHPEQPERWQRVGMPPLHQPGFLCTAQTLVSLWWNVNGQPSSLAAEPCSISTEEGLPVVWPQDNIPCSVPTICGTFTFFNGVLCRTYTSHRSSNRGIRSSWTSASGAQSTRSEKIVYAQVAWSWWWQRHTFWSSHAERQSTHGVIFLFCPEQLLQWRYIGTSSRRRGVGTKCGLINEVVRFVRQAFKTHAKKTTLPWCKEVH